MWVQDHTSALFLILDKLFKLALFSDAFVRGNEDMAAD